ncbi:MAG: hypothetical protein HYT48_01860 [Candidatus Vogelbacteria bacterium]|nr:hypothetical protein [Candidatus Vogelbacteria bacterium]
MVKKALNFLHQETNSLHQTALLLALATLASQVLSLIQYRLLAATFGAGRELDIFYAAFRIPDLIYVSVASFVSISVLIPVIIKKLNNDSTRDAQIFLNTIFTAFCAVMIGVTLTFYFVVPHLSAWIVPGFPPEAAGEWLTLTRIILLSPLLLGLSNLFGSFTQSLRKFLVYSLSPIFYQLGNIIGIAFFYHWWGLPGLAWGTALGAALHVFIQLPTLKQSDFWPSFTININYSELKKIVFLSLPRTVGMSANQLTLLILVSLASLMAAGSIAVFNLAYSLQGIPIAIIGASYSVAAFPMLAKLHHAGGQSEFNGQASAAVRQILFWAIPAAVLFIVLRAQIVRVIFGGGNFDWGDTRLTAAALALFAVSAAAQSLVLLFVRGYYAAGQTKKPLLINLGSAAVTVILAYGLVRLFQVWPAAADLFNRWLRVGELPRTPVLALPLAFTLGSLLNVALFWRWWQKDFGRLGSRVRKTLWQSLVSGLLAGLVAYTGLNFLDNFLDIRTLPGIFLQGFIAGLVAIVVNIAVLRWQGSEELHELESALKKRFWKVKPLGAEMPEL